MYNFNFAYEDNSKKVYSLLKLFGIQFIESTELSEPFPELKEAASALGHLNTFPDPDNVVRKSLLQFMFNEQLIESFSRVIAQKYLEHMGETVHFDKLY